MQNGRGSATPVGETVIDFIRGAAERFGPAMLSCSSRPSGTSAGAIHGCGASRGRLQPSYSAGA